ncbi:hypothetical protein U1Q18_039721, partial [Sarracenia purpurea var. burkii]
HLHIRTDRVYTSRHVVFDESTFPYAMTSSQGSATSSSATSQASAPAFSTHTFYWSSPLVPGPSTFLVPSPHTSTTTSPSESPTGSHSSSLQIAHSPPATSSPAHSPPANSPLANLPHAINLYIPILPHPSSQSNIFIMHILC